jgi:NAD(P)H-dependent FMN reductase
VLITPEYNHGYPAVLKNALDHVFAEWNGKPVGFVGYGGPGAGLRAVEQLRPGRRRARDGADAAAGRHPNVYAAFDEQGSLREAERFDHQAVAVLDELAGWSAKLLGARGTVTA